MNDAEQKLTARANRAHGVAHALMRRFRAARMRFFVERFGITDATRILDIGGTAFNWTLIERHPQVTIINVDGPEGREGNLEYRRADGRALPFADNSFDIAYSNSVIEHVGDADKRAIFAAELRRVAPRYFVQTPAPEFFFDTHTLTPFFHWLPLDRRRRWFRYATVLGWMVRPPAPIVDFLVDGTELLQGYEIRRLFPDGRIHRETFLGMTKAYIAYKV